MDIDGCFDDDPTRYDVSWEFSNVWSNGYFISYYFPESCLYEGDYVKVTFSPPVMVGMELEPNRDEWIELWVWIGDDDLGPYAYVYDSDGSFYYVGLYIDGYGPLWP